MLRTGHLFPVAEIVENPACPEPVEGSLPKALPALSLPKGALSKGRRAKTSDPQPVVVKATEREKGGQLTITDDPPSRFPLRPRFARGYEGQVAYYGVTGERDFPIVHRYRRPLSSTGQRAGCRSIANLVPFVAKTAEVVRKAGASHPESCDLYPASVSEDLFGCPLARRCPKRGSGTERPECKDWRDGLRAVREKGK